ncbi:PTS system nitrogen regulatory IIA component [Limimaricola variabilis]|jgi:PTS system nitrogen regulatory IIA component|uniref:PTS system nitrogen regulatory IIA component n=1 Tax=Limimaricola variabilis TaxID=1492771 RepID=A0ABR6HLL1_9RHOB|nr:PTS sugar transporter subunit IIA [Limimaricola variabilis]MBB3711423.1 PTS system nitrogen regulatory IIA component [Limimaricola variabilis]WPY93602.1 PTS sugar transporter subunit IIA [Limimaricola variabilis]
MQISEILPVEGVKLLASTSSKKRLFQDLGDLAESCYDLPPGRVVEALLEREALGPTGVGHGVALPHARLEGVERVRGLFIRLEKPLDFDAVDRQPVDLVFCLLAPGGSGVEHLKALALVSRTLRDAATCQKLRANAEIGTLHAILTEGPATQAA